MIAQIEESVFPRKADLEGIVSDGCYSSVRALLQEQGAFLACKQEDFSEHLSRFVMGEEFYQEAFGQFERVHHGMALTGIRFRTKDASGLVDQLRLKKGVLLSTKYGPRLVSVDGPNSQGETVCSIQYEKMNPRFAAYRRREIHEVDLILRIIDGGIVEVSSMPRSNTDSLVVRDVAMDIMETNKGDLFDMNITRFAAEDRVELFDNLIKDKASRAWRIDEVCGLSVRSANIGEGDEKILDDSDTRVLHSAVLEGKGLREHQIVKDLINEHFYFNSATLWTWMGNINLQIRLRIDFKQKPHVLVVTAETAREIREAEGGAEKWETIAVSREMGQQCARWYWDLVHTQFEEQLATVKARAKHVARGQGENTEDVEGDS